MSDALQEAQHEFWRPPLPAAADEIVVREAVASALPTMAEVCPRCATEFLLGSLFCHACGGRRPEAISASSRADAAEIAGLWENVVGRVQSVSAAVFSRETWSWIKFPSWLRYLHFHQIKLWLGLSTASLIAFMIGLGCVAGALVQGLSTVNTYADWQGIQYYRAEWLLAATAAFVAGILLKKPTERDGE